MSKKCEQPLDELAVKSLVTGMTTQTLNIALCLQAEQTGRQKIRLLDAPGGPFRLVA